MLYLVIDILLENCNAALSMHQVNVLNMSDTAEQFGNNSSDFC